MNRIESRIINVLVVLLVCATTTALVTAHALDNQKAGAKQSGVKDKAAPKSSNKLDDDFSPKAKSNKKSSGQSGVGNRDTAAPEEISDPLDGSTPKDDSTPANSVPASTPAASTLSTTSAVPRIGVPKKAGVMRICLVTPRAQMSNGDTAQAAEAVRNTFNSYLTGPTIEPVALTARLPAQALEEARQSECGYVLYTSVTQKKGGSGGGLLG